MIRDEAIEAIRAVRHAISAEHGHDTKRLVQHYREMERLYADRILREGHEPSARAKELRRTKPATGGR